VGFAHHTGGQEMPHDLVRTLASIVVALGAIAIVTSQCRKPRWWLGRLFLKNMNARHSALTDWGLKQVPLESDFRILDVGCGGGRTIDKLAAAASAGKVDGIDYSAASVAEARSTNARWIEAGRVEIQPGSVSQLPFPERSFDLVTAVETHYYWPDLNADLREVLRVLKPGGRVVLIAETYKGRSMDFIYRPAMMLLQANYLSVDEHRNLLVAAGYSEVVVHEERRKGWICAVGIRPQAV